MRADLKITAYLQRLISDKSPKLYRQSIQLTELYKEVDETIGLLLDDLLDKLREIVARPESYLPDYMIDLFMRSVQENKEIVVTMDDDMSKVWNSEKASHPGKDNRQHQMDNIRSHYPIEEKELVTGDILQDACFEFHKLMMSQSNIVLFDIGTDTTYVQKYSFYKAHSIYEQLKGTWIGNLVLMEKSLGIGFANCVFPYLKDFKSREKAENTLGLIGCGLKIKGFCLRKAVMISVFDCLEQTNFNENILDIVEKILNLYVEFINEIEEQIQGILRDAKCRIKKEDLHYNQLLVEECWKSYFSEEEAYSVWIEQENLFDWRTISSWKNCFWQYNGSDNLLFNLYNGTVYKKVIHDILGEMREYILPVPFEEGPGEKIEQWIIKKIQLSPALPDTCLSEECLSEMCLLEECRLCENLSENCLWEKYIAAYNDLKDLDLRKAKSASTIKKNQEKINHLHVYALLFEYIVEKLNR